MKKVIALFTIAVCFATGSAMAQGGQQMTPEQRQAMMKERYKGLGLNDVQVDSVMKIQSDFRPQMMALRDVPEADRAAKMKEIADARNKRLEAALPADLAKKVIEAMAMRPGGGGGRQ